MTEETLAYYRQWIRDLMFQFAKPIRTLICEDGALEAALGFGLDDLDNELASLEQTLGRLEDIATCAQAETALR